MQPVITPLSHERLVANAHELGTSQDSLETSQDGLGCVLASPCMSRQVTETEREIPFFSHRLVAAVDFILSQEINFSPPPATKMQLNILACPGLSQLVRRGLSHEVRSLVARHAGKIGGACRSQSSCRFVVSLSHFLSDVCPRSKVCD